MGRMISMRASLAAVGKISAAEEGAAEPVPTYPSTLAFMVAKRLSPSSLKVDDNGLYRGIVRNVPCHESFIFSLI